MPRTPRRPGDPPAKGRAQRKARRPKVPKEAPLDAHWDDFYARRGGRFYKDRHWLRRELPELMPDEVNSDPLKHQDELTSDGEAVRRDDAFPAARELGDYEMVGLEAGCGCGAAAFPLLRANPHLFLLCADFSAEAIGILKARAEYGAQLRSRARRCHAWVADAGADPHDATWEPCDALAASLGGLHVITLIFALSALTRARAAACVARCARLLRPGGLLFVRDYAAGDLAQARLDAKPGRRTGEEGGYARGEGTLARYFSLADFDALFAGDFDALDVGFVERDITNRKQRVTMARRWIQGKYARKGAPPFCGVPAKRANVAEAAPAVRRPPAPPRGVSTVPAAAPPAPTMPPAGSTDTRRPRAGACLECSLS